MRSILFHTIIGLSLIASAGANATVVSELVEVRCEEAIHFFRWRSVEVSSDTGFGDSLASVYKGASPQVTSLARAGFQGPAAYCNFGDANGLVEPTRIAVFADQVGSDGDEIWSASLRVNDVELANIGNVWPFGSRAVEHVIEIFGDSGKLCTMEFDSGSAGNWQSGVSEELEQSMSCRFFQVSKTGKKSGKEGK